MYITSKLNNKLKFFQYFSILKNNDILFISLVQKDFLKEISGKKKELSEFGFKFKTVNVKKIKNFNFFKNIPVILNGNIFFIYKKKLDATDVKNFKYIIKNFPIIIFSYKNFFYSKKKLTRLFRIFLFLHKKLYVEILERIFMLIFFIKLIYNYKAIVKKLLIKKNKY